MSSPPISFFSEGSRLAGDLFLSGGLHRGETRRYRAVPRDKIAPRRVLLIITDNDRPAPQDESDALYRHAREPKRPVVLSGFIHCEVYGDAAFQQVMAAKLAWFEQYPFPRGTAKLDAPAGGS